MKPYILTRRISAFLLLVQVALLLAACAAPTPLVSQPLITGTGPAVTQLPTDTPTPTATITPTITVTPTVTITPVLSTPTTTTLPLVTQPLTITQIQGPDGRVTIAVPEGGRFVVMGDSISYGSTFTGANTYENICEDRWPYVEQLAVETGIKATSSLDRGDSMKTPFYEQKVGRRMEKYCQPPEGTPLLDTAVAGSNTNEWLADLRSYPVFVEALEDTKSPVAFFLIGADIFAETLGKPPVTPEQYEQNAGQLISYMGSYHKVVYIARLAHVRVGSAVPANRLNAYNEKIDALNQRLQSMIDRNGYQDANGQWVSFGAQEIIQDGYRLWVDTAQAGPQLDVLSDSFPDSDYASDGLHFHVEGYNKIGLAWAQALKAPVQVNTAKLDE